LPESNIVPYGLAAHRGLAASKPENTIVALRAAIEAGAPIVEFDLQLTADGVPVLLHDATFARTGGSSWDVRDIPLAQACTLGVGYPTKFGTQFADQQLETLAEAVSALGEFSSVHSLIEVKGESIERFGLDACMAPILEGIRPLQGKATVISFEADAVRAARSAGWPIGLCLDDADSASVALAHEVLPELLLVDEVTLRVGADLISGPWRIACWEVVDPDRALELRKFGVHYVETMAVDTLLADARVASALA
jgi:glycerophosphoryl diester phosphodiesterase